MHLDHVHFSKHSAAALSAQCQSTIDRGFSLINLARTDYFKIENEVKKEFTRASQEYIKERAQLKFGEEIERLIQGPAAAYLGAPVTKQGDGKRKIDFTVGGHGSRDGLESKSSKSKRPAMLVNAGKIAASPPGRLWFVYSNYDGAWIMEYKRGEFERKYGEPRQEAGWSEKVFEVPVADMVPIALFV
jgi:hypothetical protein